MGLENYQDYSLHWKLRQMINASQYSYQLRTLANCGTLTDINGVHVLANGKNVNQIPKDFSE